MTKLEEIVESQVKTDHSKNRCSDYDDDCKDVKDHHICWEGNECLDKADGYCPMLINLN